MNYKDKFLTKYAKSITGLNDLTGNENPSILFYILTRCFGYLLENDVEKVISINGVKLRSLINPIIRELGVHFLTNPQIVENRNILQGYGDDVPDKEIVLPDTPVIWAANHAFKDDTLASILAIKRHAYILFGSLPQFYNTFDGVTAWLNGVVMTNRKVKASRQASMEKALQVMAYGADLMMFPEGVWNKSPNLLLLDLWPGIWRIAKETGASVVPVVHYIRDCADAGKHNPIHTVVDDPVRVDDLSEKAGLEYIREILAYWYYLMMEKYGTSKRTLEVKKCNNSYEVWEKHLLARVKTASRYDEEIEFSADYCPSRKVEPKDVWKAVADIVNINKDNATLIAYANLFLEWEIRNDFQHRF